MILITDNILTEFLNKFIKLIINSNGWVEVQFESFVLTTGFFLIQICLGIKGCIRCLKALVHAFKPKWKNWWATWYGFQFLYASCSTTNNVCHFVFLGNQCPFYWFLLLMFNTWYTITSLTTDLMKNPFVRSGRSPIGFSPLCTGSLKMEVHCR